MMKDLVMDGMAGFVPSVSDPKDLHTATIKGVFLRLNPNSKALKSPYISQCSCFSNGGVGALLMVVFMISMMVMQNHPTRQCCLTLTHRFIVQEQVLV